MQATKQKMLQGLYKEQHIMRFPMLLIPQKNTKRLQKYLKQKYPY